MSTPPGAPPTVGFLRAQYLLLLAASGSFGPFVALHLSRLGWSGEGIAAIFALTSAIWIVSGPFWASVSDRLGHGGRMFATLGTLAGGCMAIVAGAPSTAAVAFGLAGNALFRGPLSVLLDGQVVGALEARGRDVRDYGTVRLWGSLGFLASALLAGHLAQVSTGTALATAGALLVAAALLGLGLDGARPAPAATPSSAWSIVRGDRVLHALLATAILHGAALAAYDGYFSLLVAERGLTAQITGIGLAVGVLAEATAMQSGSRILARLEPARVLAIGGWVAAVRLLLCAVVTDPVALVAIQALHGVAFGAWWVALVEVARRRSPPGIRSSVQAIAGSAAYGVGPLLCQGIAALVLDRGGVAALYVVASSFAAAGALVARTVGETTVATHPAERDAVA